jgi:hypothetical protein
MQGRNLVCEAAPTLLACGSLSDLHSLLRHSNVHELHRTTVHRDSRPEADAMTKGVGSSTGKAGSRDRPSDNCESG